MVTTRSQNKQQHCVARNHKKTIKKLSTRSTFSQSIGERTKRNHSKTIKKRRQPLKSTIVTGKCDFSAAFMATVAAKREFSSAFDVAMKDPGTQGLKTFKGVLDDIFAAAQGGNLASRYGLDGDSLAW